MFSQLRQIMRQSPQHRHRDWYNSSNADLYVWKKDGNIQQFEFCYNKGLHEKSIRWQLAEKHSHCQKMCVDDGESGFHSKRSAILKACGKPNWQEAAHAFRLVSRELPLALRHFILCQLTNELMN